MLSTHPPMAELSDPQRAALRQNIRGVREIIVNLTDTLKQCSMVHPPTATAAVFSLKLAAMEMEKLVEQRQQPRKTPPELEF